MLIFAEKNDRNKEEKRKMKRIISILLYIAILLPLAAQPPKHEVRAAWITAVYGLDWPQTRATSPESIRKQQAELIEILDRLKAANFNTVLFQTRTRGDVLYKSAIEPYNSILTGKVGGDPGYDPLLILWRQSAHPQKTFHKNRLNGKTAIHPHADALLQGTAAPSAYKQLSFYRLPFQKPGLRSFNLHLHFIPQLKITTFDWP